MNPRRTSERIALKASVREEEEKSEESERQREKERQAEIKKKEDEEKQKEKQRLMEKRQRGNNITVQSSINHTPFVRTSITWPWSLLRDIFEC